MVKFYSSPYLHHISVYPSVPPTVRPPYQFASRPPLLPSIGTKPSKPVRPIVQQSIGGRKDSTYFILRLFLILFLILFLMLILSFFYPYPFSYPFSYLFYCFTLSIRPILPAFPAYLAVSASSISIMPYVACPCLDSLLPTYPTN